MVDGVILSIFNDIRGFTPVSYFPSNIKANLLKNIILRATIFAAGGIEDYSIDRESLIDLREDGIIGVTYMSALDAPHVRGGQMLIVLINFTSEINRYCLYQNMIKILEKNKNEMEIIKSSWSGKEFSNISSIKDNLKEIYDYLIEKIVKSTTKLESQIIEEIRFTVKCPECSNEAIIFIPKKIEKLLSIPVTNLPCEHKFEVYFTKGPNFRGTSAVKGIEKKKDDLKDIFDSL
jgi:hypothetical protein